jgi:hypothetical protein
MEHVPKSDLLALAREFLKLELLLSESLNTEQLRKFLILARSLEEKRCRSIKGSPARGTYEVDRLFRCRWWFSRSPRPEGRDRRNSQRRLSSMTSCA